MDLNIIKWQQTKHLLCVDGIDFLQQRQSQGYRQYYCFHHVS